MLDTTLAIRYARAMFRITKAAGNAALASEELLAFCRAVDAEKTLKRVLYHPEITAAEKKQVVTELLTGAAADPTTVRFIVYIIGKKRIFHLPSMAREFAALIAEDENRITVRIDSFKPLSDDLQARISGHLATMLEKKIAVVSRIDPSLMGGIRLTLGNRVIDGSVAHQLKNLTRIVTAV
jgi:F-type H+-transporting ATPase subunit delta